jgi:hypothetical protein
MAEWWEFSATVLVKPFPLDRNVQLLEIFAFVGNSFLSFFRFDESHSSFCLN